MSILLLFAALLAPASASAPDYLLHPLAVGRAFQYRPGVMERVLRTRRLAWPSGVLGAVSVPGCHHVGSQVYARIGSERGWWFVVDCSNPRDLPAQRAKRLVIEVGYKTAARQKWDYYLHGGPGHAQAEIYLYRR